MTNLAMEFVPGQTLHARLAAGPLSTADALRFAGEVAEALEEAHNHRFVHRDLKPANVMLTAGHAKVMDFGLAKQFATAGSAEAAATATVAGPLTEIGTAIGTPDYMSPEQVRGEPLDQRSDLFSFGILLCELMGSIILSAARRRRRPWRRSCAILRPERRSATRPDGADPEAAGEVARRTLSVHGEVRADFLHLAVSPVAAVDDV